MELVAPSAKRLGWLWDHDYCSFIDVTLGLGRLQRVLISLGEEPVGSKGSSKRHRVLMAPSSHEQHTLGAQIVTEMFRRDGWETWNQMPGNRRELAQLVQKQWLDAVGFSASSVQALEHLQLDIATVRAVSQNTNVVILVGGPMFLEHPHLVEEVGADLMARDGREAPALLRQVINLALHAEA